jgi:hypothetical protein
LSSGGSIPATTRKCLVRTGHDAERRTLGKTGLIASGELFFRKSDNFSFFGRDPSEGNLKFLAGNVITEGDIHSVAQHLTKELSMALSGLGPL